MNARNECACFPGTCRGGEVVSGRTATGQHCKAEIPARRRTDRPVDEALAELMAERDALKAQAKELGTIAAGLSEALGRHMEELGLLRAFYARQDAATWAAVRDFRERVKR